MSIGMSEHKKDEIEGFEKQEKDDMSKIRKDICAVCGLQTVKFPYIAFLQAPYGWLECHSCGTIFCPKSLRDQKLEKARNVVEKPQYSIII